jgi:multidrug efflux pump subunit AcrA (membrane-fusion protein)
MPRRWYQAPIEYEVFVEVVEQNPLIRSGLRAKTEIFVERLQNVVQVPLSSLFKSQSQDKGYSVFVKHQNRVEIRPVQIGSNNDKFVVVNQGLAVGEQVLLDADSYNDNIDIRKMNQP